MDPPAGGQIYPTMQGIATYAFDAEEELDPLVINLYAYPDGEIPALYEDELAKSPVLNLTSGYARLNNPLKNVAVQNAVSYTFWMKQVSDPLLDEEGNPVEGRVMPQDLTSPIMYWENENGSASLSFSANGWLKYDGLDGDWEENNPEAYKTGYITPDLWHFVALIIRDHGYAIYVDGDKKADVTSSDLDYSNAVQFASNAPYMYFNYGADTHTSFYLEDLNIYRNEITSKEIARPKKGDIWGNDGPGGGTSFEPMPDPIYFNDFERGLGEATVVGGGSIQDAGGNFGKVFQNIGGAVRENYLLLPSDALKKTGETNELTVNMWINSANAGNSDAYAWSPIFAAYSEAPNPGNHAPLVCCQYRGVIANNMNGADNVGGNWCDYVDAQCDQGKVEQANVWNAGDWLEDKQWHMYTVVFTKTTAAVYFDGELHNSWTIDGVSDGQRCEIFGDSRLSYICVGGNQSWWNDPDAGFMFDDVAIYNKALTPEQVQTCFASKNNMPSPIYFNNFERGFGESSAVGAGLLQDVGGNYGTVFQNATGAPHANYLLLPSDVLMGTGETQEMTVAMWVNATPAASNSDYAWSPIFSAYSEAPNPGNHAPLICCQYRGVIANNMNGADNVGGNWCDYVDAQCDQGKVEQANVWNAGDWLEDKQWHHYAVTFTKTTAAVYFDGELHNSWTIDGVSDGQRCEIFGDSRLSYICVGGNQSWWDDWDGEWWIDNVSIYNKSLTAEQVQQLVSMK